MAATSLASRDRKRRSGIRGAIAIGWLALGPYAAQAQTTEPITLDWTAPATCPARQAVLAQVYRLLGGSPPSDAPKRIKATATIDHPTGDHWQLVLRIESADAVGMRTVRAESCQALAEVAALVVALAFDPIAATERRPPPTPPPASAPVPSTAPAPPVTPPGSARPGPTNPPRPGPARAPIEAFPGAHAALDAGALARVAPGIELSPGVALGGAVRVDLGGTYWPPQRKTLATPAGAGGDIDLLVGSLVAGSSRLLLPARRPAHAIRRYRAVTRSALCTQNSSHEPAPVSSRVSELRQRQPSSACTSTN
jgi:hypothetical protein